MPKDLDDLTVEDLTALFEARFNAEHRAQMKFSERLNRELGNGVQEQKPGAVAIQNKIRSRLSKVAARRLKKNLRTVPLLSVPDFVQFISPMMSEFEKDEGREFDSEERKALEKFASAMFENLVEACDTIVPHGQNPYDVNRRWVTTVLGLAAERDVPPAELLASEEGVDEITRRMLTKNQFIALSKKTMNKFLDADSVKKIFLRPLLDAMTAEAGEEELREMERELETAIMPQLREIAKRAKVVTGAWLNDEVERIYGTA